MDSLVRATWSLIQGCLIASLVWMSMNHRSGGRVLLHPGHWILFINGLLVIVIIGAHTVLCLQVFARGELPTYSIYAINSLVYVLAYLSAAIVWFRIRKLCQPGEVWRFVFVCYSFYASLVSIDCFLQGVLYFNAFMYLVWGMQLVVLGAVAIAAFGDIRNQRNRDWLHWFGVCVTMIAFTAFPLVRWLAKRAAENSSL